ncbi:MAG: potassium transporter TrkA [Candidatus Tectimicrobiota bacterium]|nr:MAG: potassium transporter TrkA [Candidatus Tectomicrobia bacterium]
MKVEEVVLPGVGRKYTITTRSGDRLVIVVHSSGKRELQYFEAGEGDEPTAALDLTDEEAREIGAILSGVLFHPEATGDVTARLAEHTIEWMKVEPGDRCVSRTVGECQEEAQLHAPQAHILAILRAGQALVPNPPPESRIEVGDTLILAGSRQGVNALKHELSH